MLNEKQIKCMLLDFLDKKYRARMIGVEVPFLSGKRWADVLLVTKKGELIAFEIKSDRDSLRRMSRQLEDYTKTFNQVFVILSSKFRKNDAMRTLSKAIGYAFIERGRLKFIRQAYSRRRLSKANLLFFLWKKDLSMYRRGTKDTVEKLRARMKRANSLNETKKHAVNALLGRYQNRYKTFLSEKSKRVQKEDLDYLTKTFWDTF